MAFFSIFHFGKQEWKETRALEVETAFPFLKTSVEADFAFWKMLESSKKEWKRLFYVGIEGASFSEIAWVR